MTDEYYRPRDLAGALARVSEECSEVIKLVAKAQRFGLHDVHPQKGKKNIDLIMEELADIEEAKRDLVKILVAQLPSYIKAVIP